MVFAEVTGRGVVYSLTVNYQRWLPDLEVPYAIVLVEFPGRPGVRVAGRLRGCPPEQARIGMAVEVGFEPGPGGFAIPSFVGGAPVSREEFERRVVISGVGQSAIGRQVDRSGLALTLDAIVAAVADAGLTLDDIDGLAMFPGGGAANLPGYANGNLYEVQDALRITTTWRQGIVEGMALPCYGPALAVATGQARHAVVWRTVKEGSAARAAGGRPAYGSVSHGSGKPSAEGPLAWLLPVGMLSPVVQVAPYAARYLHEYGVSREQLAWIPVTQRAHAALNPDAVYTLAADRRGLPRVADDLLADVPVRLRRPRRRRHRLRRLGFRDGG